MRRAVFLDRDGTIMEEVNYCSRAEDVHVFAGAAAAVTKLQDAGFLVIVITNQSGIGRGMFTVADYDQVHAEMLAQLRPVKVDATYYCEDTPEQAGSRRKPNPGMLLEAAQEFDIDLSHSYMVGDGAGDIGAGRNAGTRTILVDTGCGRNVQDAGEHYRAGDLTQAVEWILQDAL